MLDGFDLRVAIEFRSKPPGARRRRVWDRGFSIASIGSSLLMGVAFGNVIRGIPVGADGEFAGSALTLLNPYALLTGITTAGINCIFRGKVRLDSLSY